MKLYKPLVGVFFFFVTFITDIFSCGSAPTTVGSYWPIKSYEVNETILFSGEGSFDNDFHNGNYKPAWYWDFNYNGNPLQFHAYKISSNYGVDWSYSQSGTYVVAVKYSDDEGMMGNIVTMTVTVGDLNRCYYLTDHLGSVKMTVGPGPATMGLVGYWPLEGDGNDESDNGNTASLFSFSNIADETIVTNERVMGGEEVTINESEDIDMGVNSTIAQLHDGASFVSEGKFGQGIQITNNNGYLDLGSSQNLHPTRISISAWVKPTQIYSGPNSIIVDNGGGYRLSYYADGSLWFLVHDDDAISTMKNANNEIEYGVSSCITLNQWNHVVASYGYDRKLRIYINGELKGTSSATTGGDGDINYYPSLGNVTVSSSSNSGITGIVDEVKIYNRELVQSEINRDFTHDVSILGWDDYDPWGKQLTGRCQVNSSTEDKYKFTGKERDKESNFDYFGARYYDSEIGRWLQTDPLANKYPGRSPYNYALCNPFRYIDPNGDSINVSGEAQNNYTNLLSQETGLLLQLRTNGNLEAIPGPIQSNLISSDLRQEVSTLLSSANVTSVIAINANGQVYFDADPRVSVNNANNVDMGDFAAISNVPELQCSLMGHILMERNTEGNFANAHNAALQFETQIMNNLTGLRGTQRTSPFTDRSSAFYHQVRGPLNGNLYYNGFDYGTHYYYIGTPNQTPLNQSVVIDAVRENR